MSCRDGQWFQLVWPQDEEKKLEHLQSQHCPIAPSSTNEFCAHRISCFPPALHRQQNLVPAQESSPKQPRAGEFLEP